MDHEIEEVWDADMEAAAAEMIGETRQAKAQRLRSFRDVQLHPDGTVILQSTTNDHPYVVCDGAMVVCDEDTLWQLLSDIDHIIWSDGGEPLPMLRAGERLADGGPSGGATLTFAALTYDAGKDEGTSAVTAGGMWVHPDLHARGLADAITDVIEGQLSRLGLTEVPPAPEGVDLHW
jgi:hypothetical protein